MSFSKCATFPPASRLEAAGFFHLMASHYAFVNAIGHRQMKNSRCFKPAGGGGGGEVAHFENDTASEK